MITTPPPDQIASRICASVGARLASKLGHGAFKDTFLAELSDLGLVALKILKPGFSIERLEREVSAMQRCNHRCIARLFHVQSISIAGADYPYLLEEYLDGGSLRDWLDLVGTLPFDDVTHTVRELADALIHLRSLDLVHRDIKPENIMFRKGSKDPVLVDFGLVRDLGAGSLTQSFALQGPGTPLYAAPEQLRNEKELIDWRADQFSLGVTASFCLLGNHPYAEVGDRPESAVARVAGRHGPRRSLESEIEGSGGTASRLARMVQPWPVRRYRNPEDLLEAWSS